MRPPSRAVPWWAAAAVVLAWTSLTLLGSSLAFLSLREGQDAALARLDAMAKRVEGLERALGEAKGETGAQARLLGDAVAGTQRAIDGVLMGRLAGVEAVCGEAARTSAAVLARKARAMPPARTLTDWGEALKAFRSMHREMLDGTLAPRRLLVVHAWGGFGNVALSVVSGFLMAMLTDRALLVVEKQGMLKDFELPGFAWLTEDGQLPKAGPGETEITIQHSAWPTQALACEDLDEVYKETIVNVHANNYFAPLMLYNPRYSKVLDGWFGASPRRHVYRTMFRALFQPVARVLELKNTFMDSTFSPDAALTKDMLERCLVLQLRHTTMPNPPAVEDALRAVVPRVRELVKISDEVVVYIVADSPEWRGKLVDMVQGYNTADSNDTVGTTPRLVPRFVTAVDMGMLTKEGTSNGLAELLAASECKLGCVTSRGSTYGYNIAALAETKVCLRYGGSGLEASKPLFTFLEDTEPVYHGQFLGAPLGDAKCQEGGGWEARPGLLAKHE